MDIYFPLSGELKCLEFPSILFNLYKKSISGILELRKENMIKRIIIENGKIIFASSNLSEDSLREYLLRKQTIDEDIAQKVSGYMKKKRVKFGKALLELGYIGYDLLWNAIREHLKHIVFSLFHMENVCYQIITERFENQENITLNCDILSIIIEGMRNFKDDKSLFKELKSVRNVYLYKPESIENLQLKPYELHILDLVEKESGVKEIIQKSELLRIDTLKILLMFLILEAISTEKIEKKIIRRLDRRSQQNASVSEDKGIVPTSTFVSFDEALSCFNVKYELIYKVLSKEIGPIALSILTKAIEDISEKLPFLLKKLSLGADGSIQKSLIQKSVWYYDFNRNIGEFVRGLEEILYAEIYAVKRHLGVEYEQQILKWIN